MICIFCKQDSHNSASIEHIIPESLGNTRHVLPQGVVCDKCNNYFAREVEKPLLISQYFTHARFRNALPSKKGRIPALEIVYCSGSIELGMYRTTEGQQGLYPIDDKNAKRLLDYLQKHNRGEIYIPIPVKPDPYIVARFLAKVALEILTFGVMHYPGWESEVVFRKELDEVREFSRYGSRTKLWPYYERRIYPEHKKRTDPDRNAYETLHEFDLLYTRDQELFAVICVLGVEYTINLGGPEIEGYLKWLEENDYESPLYTGKNTQ